MSWNPNQSETPKAKLTVERGPGGQTITKPVEDVADKVLDNLFNGSLNPRPKLRLFRADDGKWTVTETIGNAVVTWSCRSWLDAVAWRAVCWLHARLWVRNWGPQRRRK